MKRLQERRDSVDTSAAPTCVPTAISGGLNSGLLNARGPDGSPYDGDAPEPTHATAAVRVGIKLPTFAEVLYVICWDTHRGNVFVGCEPPTITLDMERCPEDPTLSFRAMHHCTPANHSRPLSNGCFYSTAEKSR
jgi:hypothetical protein